MEEFPKFLKKAAKIVALSSIGVLPLIAKSSPIQNQDKNPGTEMEKGKKSDKIYVSKTKILNLDKGKLIVENRSPHEMIMDAPAPEAWVKTETDEGEAEEKIDVKKAVKNIKNNWKPPTLRPINPILTKKFVLHRGNTCPGPATVVVPNQGSSVSGKGYGGGVREMHRLLEKAQETGMTVTEYLLMKQKEKIDKNNKKSKKTTRFPGYLADKR